MSKLKSNTLSLKSKIDLIQCYEEKKLSVKQLVLEFKCGKTQVYDIIKNKDKLKSEWLNNERSGDSKRKLRTTGNAEINTIVYEWFLDAKARNLPISGPILKTYAKMVAERLNKTDFKASNGWLESFRHRHNIRFGHGNGEANNVDMNIVHNWKNKIASLVAKYQPENITNCKRTELFLVGLPNKMLKLKSDICVGTNKVKSKEVEENFEEENEDAITKLTFVTDNIVKQENNIDENVSTDAEYHTLDEVNVNANTTENSDTSEDEDDGCTGIGCADYKIKNSRDALDKLMAFQEFAEKLNCDEMIKPILELRAIIENHLISRLKQKKSL